MDLFTILSICKQHSFEYQKTGQMQMKDMGTLSSTFHGAEERQFRYIIWASWPAIK